MPPMQIDANAPVTTVGDGDSELAERLGKELTDYNTQATGVGDQRGLSVQVRDADGDLVAGLTGWTWGTCAGIELVWVREDQRRSGLGGQLLDAAETEARKRGCTQILVSSFTFQAPDFYAGNGYVEFARTEGIPTAGSADVHMVKVLRALDGSPRLD
jgi:GNAT superfamily N-acetyltransferase